MRTLRRPLATWRSRAPSAFARARDVSARACRERVKKIFHARRARVLHQRDARAHSDLALAPPCFSHSRAHANGARTRSNRAPKKSSAPQKTVDSYFSNY